MTGHRTYLKADNVWAMRFAPLCRPTGPSLFHVSGLRPAAAIAGECK